MSGSRSNGAARFTNCPETQRTSGLGSCTATGHEEDDEQIWFDRPGATVVRIMKLRTLGLLGPLTFLTCVVFVQVGCSTDSLNHAGTGGFNGSSGVGGSGGFGGQLGIGGQVGIGGCSDWLAGQGGNECGSPVVTAVDADTGAVICDPSFAVMAVDAGVICHPTGNPFELHSFDGAATCTFSLQSLNGIEAQVEVQVVAPGYEPGLVSIVPCPSGRDVKYVVPLAPIGDAGRTIQDASGHLGTNCTEPSRLASSRRTPLRFPHKSSFVFTHTKPGGSCG